MNMPDDLVKRFAAQHKVPVDDVDLEIRQQGQVTHHIVSLKPDLATRQSGEVDLVELKQSIHKWYEDDHGEPIDIRNQRLQGAWDAIDYLRANGYLTKAVDKQDYILKEDYPF